MAADTALATLQQCMQETACELDGLRATLSADELEIDEDSVLRRAQWLAAGTAQVLDEALRVQFNLRCGESRIQATVTLLPGYPLIQPPRFRLHNPGGASVDTERLSAALSTMIAEEYSGQPCLWPMAEFLLSRAAHFAVSTTGSAAATAATTPAEIHRTFIYFHHIYNSTKRRNIVSWAHELSLTGFSWPGKPGVVCAEGAEADVQSYVQQLRALPWQKMQVRVTQTDTVRRFPPLAELGLATHGEFRAYLREHGVGDAVFVQLFDVGEVVPEKEGSDNST